MTLLIVESPAKAKTISKYLGSGYEVIASVGHVRDLPKSNKKAVDIKDGFTPHYEVVKGKERVVAEIERRAKKADKVYLATDPDREGEAIAWHVMEACKLKAQNPKLKIERVVFHEITKEAVEEALEHPRAIDENLKEAQEARRVLDRLVGYDLSGLIWKKLRYGLSAGRVQSPALRILAEREREIRAFIPEAYWTITANLGTPTLPFLCEEEPRDEKEADRIVTAGKEHPWSVTDVTQTEVKRSPKAPFTTSTLQQAASSRLGFSPSNTMRIAQKLYEAGLITYMRTDSTTLSAQVLPQIAGVIENNFGKNLVSIRQYKTKSKNAQEAHEAVRPSRVSDRNAGRTPEEKKLYDLIWRRTIASQMQDAALLRTKITAKPSVQLAEQVPDFSISGNVVVSPGWLLADPAARGEENELPRLNKGDALTLADIVKEGKETQPPNRYSEAGLIKELEKRGIGRPSTYASIIKTLLDREYVTKESRSLKPTDLGELVSSFLEEHFASYISDTFTAEMEDELDDIAIGKRTYEKTLKDFYGPFSKDVASKKDIAKINDLGDAPKELHCPLCGSPMKIKLGKSGKFYSCARFPDCTGALTLEGKEIEGPKKTGEKCPDCADGELVERDGRFGRFISCSNYPKCKYIKRDPSTSLGASTGVECPVCKIGTMVEKRGRFGTFYGCSNYPKCKNIIKTKPTGNICSLCGSLMMEGTKTIPERCSNKTCPNHNPHKLKEEKKT